MHGGGWKMSLKEKLDRFRSDSHSRFTEGQLELMRRFQDNVGTVVRRAPKVGDFLPPLPSVGGAAELRGTSRRLALVFFRGAW